MSIEDQPPPQVNDEPAIWGLVIADMRDRDKTGFQRYGTRLQPFNGRDALVDAYQEALDLVVYLRQAIYEREFEKSNSKLACARYWGSDGTLCSTHNGNFASPSATRCNRRM